MPTPSVVQPSPTVAARGFVDIWSCRAGLVALGLMVFGAKLLAIHLFGNATPFVDQWAEADLVYGPWLEGDLDWADLVALHNEHRILFPRLLALGLFAANGIWNPLLQMVVNAAIHSGFICILAWFMLRVVGPSLAPAVLGFCLVVFSLPVGWENTLAGFQSCFYFLLTGGVGGLWLAAGAAPLSLRWWAGVGLAAVGFFSLASGAFAFAALAALGAIQAARGVRRDRLHLAAIGVLAALFVLGILVTHQVEEHSTCRAANAIEFLAAFDRVSGWPIKVPVLGTLVRQAPAAWLLATMLRTRPPATDRRWFLLALVIWMAGQSLAIAYGRGRFGFVSSRYMDLFTVDLVTNFACLLLCVREVAARHPAAVPVAAAWTLLVLGCLGHVASKRSGPEMALRGVQSLFQEANVKAYVSTGDMTHLTDKPFLHVPSPETDKLAAILDRPVIRSFLPRNIGAPLPGSIADTAHAALVAAGYGPDLPVPPAPAWGTFAAAKAATTGTGSIAFPEPHRGYAVEIPVAGDSRAAGISLEIEVDGIRRPLVASGDSPHAWGISRTKVRGRPFIIHVTDTNPEAWVAVGSPVVLGRWDERVERLLARWDGFLISGAILAVAVATFACLAPAFGDL